MGGLKLGSIHVRNSEYAFCAGHVLKMCCVSYGVCHVPWCKRGEVAEKRRGGGGGGGGVAI